MDERLRHRRTAAQEFRRRYACGEGDGKRMSLMEPRFNLREVAKQMILLEDHLQHLVQIDLEAAIRVDV